MHRILALAILLAGCGDDAPDEAVDAGDGAVADSAIESGVVPFDSGPPSPQAQALVDEGEAIFRRVLQGETNERGRTIEKLRTAVMLAPDHPRGNFLYGMALLSAVAEDGNLDLAFDVQPALQHAADLAPHDLRIPGWLGIVQVRTADALDNSVLLDDAAMQMIAAADAYPTFNNVSLAIAFAKLPLDTEYPEMALARLEAIESCTETVCGNTTFAPHNEEGTLMLYGDVHARLGHVDDARSYYERALARPTATEWPYRDQAQAILDGVEMRAALFTNDTRDDDPLFFSEGTTSCVGCHAP